MTVQGAIRDIEQKASKEMDAILAEPLEFDGVYSHVRAYVRCRFLLEDDDFESESIAELSEYGTKKILKMQRDEDLQELSLTCTGASSSSRRKVLLMLSVGKALGFKWDPVESANIETLSQLAEGVVRHLESASSAK